MLSKIRPFFEPGPPENRETITQHQAVLTEKVDKSFFSTIILQILRQTVNIYFKKATKKKKTFL